MRDSSSRAAQLGRHSAKLARLRRILRGDEPGLTIVDGAKLVPELADRGVEIVELYATDERLAALAEVGALTPVFRGGRAFALDATTLDRLAPSRSSQGVLAVVREPVHKVGARGIVVYLDRVQDPGNVGGVIRCAAAFGAAGVACSAGCADPFSARAIRGSAGQSLLLAVERNVEFAPLAAAFRARGGSLVAAASRGGSLLARVRACAPLLLALGNEGQGLADEIASACEIHVTLPLADRVESLNVAVTAGVILACLGGVAGAPILELETSNGGAHDPSP